MNQTDWKHRLHVFPSIHSVPHLEWQRYRSSGVKWLAFDIENTLEPLVKSGERRLSQATIELLYGLYREYDFGICLATNSMSDFSYMILQLRRAGIPANKLALVQPATMRLIFWKYPAKQHPEFWQLLLAKLNVMPAQVVMSGDKLLFDVGPALDAGFHAGIWVAPSGGDLFMEKLFGRRAKEEKTRKRLNIDDPKQMVA